MQTQDFYANVELPIPIAEAEKIIRQVIIFFLAVHRGVDFYSFKS